MAKKKEVEKERKILGLCVYCNKHIYNNQKFEMIEYDVPSNWESHYKKGAVHKHCRIPAFKRFIQDLIKDISTLTWFIEEVIKTPRPCVNIKEPPKRKATKKRRK